MKTSFASNQISIDFKNTIQAQPSYKVRLITRLQKRSLYNMKPACSDDADDVTYNVAYVRHKTNHHLVQITACCLHISK